MLWFVVIACFGGSSDDVDPWAPPPLPEDLESPSEQSLELEELVGATMEAGQAGDWIGQAQDATELRRRLAAADVTVVRTMTLRAGPWTPDAVEVLASSKALGELEVLDATGAVLGPQGAAKLSKAPWLRTVKQLRLGGAGIGDEGFSSLCEGDLRQVDELDLHDNGLTVASMTSLAGGPFGRLLRLDVSDNPIGDEGLRALASTARVDSLEQLGIANVGLEERGVFYTMSSPYLAGLDRLDVRGNGLEDSYVSELVGAFGDDAIRAD